MSYYNHRWNQPPNPAVIAQQEERPFGLPLATTHFDRQDISTVLPPVSRALHDELHEATGAVPELIITNLLGTTAVATQCVYDVAYLDSIRCPTSLSVFYIAPSGSRKTSIDNELTQAHRDVQASENMTPEARYAFNADYKIWAMKAEALNKEIKEHLDNPAMLEALRLADIALQKEKPVAAKTAANIMLRDTSYAAMAKSMEHQSPCTSFVNDEATFVLKELSRLMAHLNSRWDGAILRVDRVTAEPIYQADPRMSIAWGMQPWPFAEYVKEHGHDFVHIGLGARTLIAMCRPLPPGTKPRRTRVVRDARDRHHANLTRMFKRYVEMLRAGKIERETLTLTAEAQQQFAETLDWIEANKTAQGYLARITEFANRLPEHILRVAANLHVIEEREGTEIALDILQSAILLMIFYTEQHIALFGDINTPIEEKHAEIVLKLLAGKFNEWEYSGVPYANRGVPVRWIQQRISSRAMRSKKAFVTDALMVLVNNKILIPHYDPRGELIGVGLNDYYFRNQLPNQPQVFTHF